MILATLALSLAEPQARLDRIYAQIVAGNPDLCARDACPRPVSAPTSRCGYAKGRGIRIDPGCAAKLEDSQLAFVIGHELAHVLTGTRDERGADWLGWHMAMRAGFSAEQAHKTFAQLGVKR